MLSGQKPHFQSPENSTMSYAYPANLDGPIPSPYFNMPTETTEQSVQIASRVESSFQDIYYQNPTPTLNDLNHEQLIGLLDYNQVIAPSPFNQYASEAERMQAAVREFNKPLNGNSFVMDVAVFGSIIEGGRIALAHHNNVPQLVLPSQEQVLLKLNPGGTKGYREFSQKDLVIGLGNRYLINVPQGKIAKAMLGNEPRCFGEGLHIVESQNLRLRQEDLIDTASDYFKHVNIHFLRVPPNNFAGITIEKTNYILKHRPEPYIFYTNNLEGTPKIESLKQPYITYGNYHILNIPKGKIAKISYQNEPFLLPSRRENYVFSETNFEVAGPYANASDNVIQHGAITSLMPRTGEVAVATNNGILNIIQPDPKPFLIKDGKFKFESFISKQQQTVTYPSKTRQELMRKQGFTDPDHLNYLFLKTNDNLPIGIQLLATYEIKDPARALFGIQNVKEIESHIENRIIAEISTEILECSSIDFQRASTRTSDEEESFAAIARINATAKGRLEKKFLENGIVLSNLNIETTEILDKALAQELAKNALETAKTTTTLNNIKNKNQIKNKEAEQLANQARIEQEQKNANTLSAAETKKKATIIEAESNLEANRRKAEGTVTTGKAVAQVARTNIKVDTYKTWKSSTALFKSLVLESKAKAIAKVMATEAEAKSSIMLMQTKLLNARMEAEIIKIKAQAEAEAEAIRLEILTPAQAEALRIKATAEVETKKQYNSVTIDLKNKLGEVYAAHPTVNQQDNLRIQAESIKENSKLWFVDPTLGKGQLSSLITQQGFYATNQQAIKEEEAEKLNLQVRQP